MGWKAWAVPVAVLVVACAAGPVPGEQRDEVAPPVSARQTLDRLLDALQAGQVARARGLCLAAKEFASISRRPVDREAYDRRLDGFLQSVARALQGRMKRDAIVCADALILPADRKITRDVHMAVFHVRFAREGEPGGGPTPFLFIAHRGAWKLYLR